MSIDDTIGHAKSALSAFRKVAALIIGKPSAQSVMDYSASFESHGSSKDISIAVTTKGLNLIYDEEPLTNENRTYVPIERFSASLLPNGELYYGRVYKGNTERAIPVPENEKDDIMKAMKQSVQYALDNPDPKFKLIMPKVYLELLDIDTKKTKAPTPLKNKDFI